MILTGEAVLIVSGRVRGGGGGGAVDAACGFQLVPHGRSEWRVLFSVK